MNARFPETGSQDGQPGAPALRARPDDADSGAPPAEALRRELAETRADLQAAIEKQFTASADRDRLAHRLAVAEDDFDNLLRAADIRVTFLDRDLRPRRFSRPAAPRAGEHTAETPDLPRGLAPALTDDARRSLGTGETIEHQTRSADGSWVLVRLMPYTPRLGKADGVVATFFNATAARNTTAMTRAVKTRLSHANRGLRNQLEELEDMFSIVAHELKRPVLSIDGILSAILDGEAPGTEEPDLLQRAAAECGRMHQILADIQDISRIQHRKIVGETVDAGGWIREIADRFAERAAERGVCIECECDAGAISIARGFVEDVVVNLIENALVHGSTAASPRIKIAARVFENLCEITVSDNGKGIAPEYFQRIFEPFCRLDPGSAPGSGVGLITVKRLLQRLDGTIAVTSQPGRGAAFTARIPLFTCESHADPEAGPLCVLLVEDDAIDARAIQRCLRDTGRLIHARSIADAERMLVREPFDVVLLDLSLPDGHGFELIDRMATALDTCPPIVIVTGHGEGLAPAELDATVGAYLSKDELCRESILSAIEKAISSVSSSADRT